MTSTGEAVAFWILGPLAVLAALGMITARKAVHSALMLAYVMLSLAVMYMIQDAPFLGVVQIIVYTGAIMMLFLFVLMIVGVDSSDSLVETIRGQRSLAVVAGLGFGLLVMLAIGNAALTGMTGLSGARGEAPPGSVTNATHGGNVPGLARLMFNDYLWAFELTGALLITAALGAMVLTHRRRVERRRTQRELAVERFKTGEYVTGYPAPGVYARHNAVDTPALLPDGTPAELSIPSALRARGEVRSIEEVARREIEDSREASEGSQLGKGPTP